DIGVKYENIKIQNLLPYPTTVSRNTETLADKLRNEIKEELRHVFETIGGAINVYMWTNDYKKINYLGVTIWRTVNHTIDDSNNPRIKSAVVWGTISSGSTYSNTEELMSVLNVQMMLHTTFIRQERVLGQTWDEILTMEMMKYGTIKYEIALSKNAVVNGIGQICVLVDGGWSKRSFGHN
ncbi:hypothetical protein CBL_20266, partial [Carabus blaptoides fortunei]